MKTERFYLTGAGQNRLYERSYLRKLSEEGRLEEVYAKGVLLEIDFGSKKILRRLEIQRDEMDYPVDGYATNFTVPAKSGNTLLVPSHATVYEIGLDDFKILSKISHPLFNDLHHYVIKDGNHYAVSTGCDHVVQVNPGEHSIQTWPVLADASPLTPDKDYRIINTKPHQSHPNYLFWHNGEMWVGRAKQHDCVALSRLDAPIPLADVMVHDGIEFDGLYYFTSVRGQVLVADLNAGTVVDQLDLIQKRWHLLTGWCRGLYVTADYYYVGYSVFRRTKQVENLQWLKSKLTGENPPLPTRIEKVDRKTGQVVDQFVFEPEDLNAVFWLSPADS